MEIPTDLLADDLARIFQDWQETITYRQVTSTFDPQSQTRSETITDTAVSAIVRTIPTRAVPRAAGMFHAGDLLLLLRDADMPERPPKRTSRVVYKDGVYQVVGHQRSGDALLWQIHARRV